jgi:hypothetical protein
LRAAGLPLLALAFVALIGNAQAQPRDTDPIVGFWNYGGGVVQVTGGPTSFAGTVVKATTFSTCAHPVGEVMWKITKAGAAAYTGTHSWFASGNCKPGSAGYGRSTWSIVESGESLVLHFCTTSPTDSSDTRCNDLTRAKPVATPWPPLPDALVSLASVSNGCGGGVASGEDRLGDTSTYLNSNNPLGKRYVVNFRMACNLHDAGYSGAKVHDPLNKVTIDFFLGWSQERVDNKFLDDMRKLCRAQIPASAPGALADCLGNGGKTSLGAKSRYDFVRFRGHKYYRARPHLGGVWSAGGIEVTIGQGARKVRGTWKDGDLKGEFRGTLISQDQDSLVKGYARTTVPGGTMRQTTIWIDVDPDTPDQIVFSGAALRGTFTR